MIVNNRRNFIDYRSVIVKIDGPVYYATNEEILYKTESQENEQSSFLFKNLNIQWQNLENLYFKAAHSNEAIWNNDQAYFIDKFYTFSRAEDKLMNPSKIGFKNDENFFSLHDAIKFLFISDLGLKIKYFYNI